MTILPQVIVPVGIMRRRLAKIHALMTVGSSPERGKLLSEMSNVRR
jgi:hypothetical protein